ncbi:MAG TPA: hypothetical protein VF981_16535 [Gemmatimonadaceae bacterium]
MNTDELVARPDGIYARERVRETAAPRWFIRYAEFEGVGITLAVHPHDGLHVDDVEVAVDWAVLPYGKCRSCGYAHRPTGVTGTVYEGDSLDEAHAAFDALERDLLAGRLG